MVYQLAGTDLYFFLVNKILIKKNEIFISESTPKSLFCHECTNK